MDHARCAWGSMLDELTSEQHTEMIAILNRLCAGAWCWLTLEDVGPRQHTAAARSGRDGSYQYRTCTALSHPGGMIFPSALHSRSPAPQLDGSFDGPINVPTAKSHSGVHPYQYHGKLNTLRYPSLSLAATAAPSRSTL